MKTRVTILGILAIAASVAARAQSFGTSTTSFLTLSALNFQLVEGTEGVVDVQAARSCVGDPPCIWLSSLALPSGVRITELELEACDGDSVSKISFGLNRHPVPMQDPIPVVPNQTTGIAATPGCGLFPVTVDHTVDNGANTYVVDVAAAPGNNVRFRAVRVGYQLQVSPAPDTATFSDVPTSSPIFQFVEALAASRITSGCGGGNFCPDAPVTRGQMAVFLSRALGLNFRN